MTILIQKYAPALKMYDGRDKIAVKQRTFEYGENPTNLKVQKAKDIEVGFIGQFQIEEIWKRYSSSDHIYINNSGYVTEISEKEALKLRESTRQALESEEGISWLSLNDDERKIFHECIYSSNKNHLISYKYAEGIRVWLTVKGYDLHKMVAEKFLQKPDGDDYWVHHLDNNSYNNSVTNLVYIKGSEHQSEHKALHPMSWK